MSNLTLVSRDRHGERKWTRVKDFSFASQMTRVPIAGRELVEAAMALPLAFTETSGRYSLVAMLSVMPDKNMLVGPKGQWFGAHIPLVLRGYPFRVLEQGGGEAVLCADEGGLQPVGSFEGELFFDREGNLTPATVAMRDYLAPIEANIRATDQAVSLLAEAGVIKPWNLTVNTDTGTDHTVEGLHIVSEAALNALDDDAFLKLRKGSALPIAYAQLFSMKALVIFEHLAKLQTAQPPASLPDSVSKMLSRGGDETIRFN